MEEKNDLTLVEEIENSSKQTYCSIPLDTIDNKKKVFAISESADFKVADYLNTPILLKNVFIQKYDKVNEETGEVIPKTRTILIDSEGKSYASASKGLYNSLLKLMALLGKPDEWEEPIKVMIKEVTINKGKTYAITPVID